MLDKFLAVKAGKTEAEIFTERLLSLRSFEILVDHIYLCSAGQSAVLNDLGYRTRIGYFEKFKKGL